MAAESTVKQLSVQMADSVKPKTNTSQGKIAVEEVISADSSSSSRSVMNKSKNFRNTRSFRRKGRSRVIAKPNIPLSDGDDDDAETTSESSKTCDKPSSVHISESKIDGDGKSLKTLLRTTSLRALRLSFRSRKKHSFKVKNSSKPTFSSTIKDSKFRGNVEVCSYHHCSLHVHFHDSSTPPSTRKKPSKSKKNIKQTNQISEAEYSAEREKHMNTWRLIRRHIGSDNEIHDENSSGLSADSSGEEKSSADKDVKLLAVKLVGDAIEKVLLPEIPGDASDDLSNTALNHENKASKSNKSERKAPKHWSSLKKWTVLQRFVKELEKVRKLNQRKQRNLQSSSVPDPEAETVRLRHRIAEERKCSEEWMLDYALQRAVSQLALTQKRKVKLLVKAFETVVVPQEDDDDVLSRCKPIDNGSAKRNRNEDPEKLATKTSTESEQNYTGLWHIVLQHVLPGIASKVAKGAEDEDDVSITGNDDLDSNDVGSKDFDKDGVIKLIREAVEEILTTQSPDEDNVIENEEFREIQEERKSISNWSKLKKLLLLKRSILALENAAKLKRGQPQDRSLVVNEEEVGRVQLSHRTMDERKKAEQWMLDYAVQHIVTKLTPARKRRVAMLVEAFEAVVPFPDI